MNRKSIPVLGRVGPFALGVSAAVLSCSKGTPAGSARAGSSSGPAVIVRKYTAPNGMDVVEERRADGTLWSLSYWDGLLSCEGELRNGTEYGPWRYWNKDGVMASRIVYDEEGRRARGEAWHPDGTNELVEHHEKGKQDGLCCYWKTDGTLDREKSGFYESGRRVQPCSDQDCERTAPVPDKRP